MRASLPLLACFGLLLACLCSCATRGSVPVGPPLPFHAALIPTEITPTGPARAAPEPRDDDMRLELASTEVTAALARELAPAFVRTTLLAPPEDAAGFAALGEAERDQYWQERARAAGADLLVRTRLLVDPLVTGERNEKFWLNLPLFLMTGPLCYFVGDRSYHVSARLQAEVFDASTGHAELDQFALLTLPLYAELAPQDLRFLDRADGVTDYAFSLLIPAGLLARETSAIEAEMERRVPVELGRELAAKVLGEREALEEAPRLGALRLEARAARLETLGSDRVRLGVPVQERAFVAGLRRYEVSAGATVCARGELCAADPAGRLRLEEEFAVPPGTEFLRVRLVDAEASTRSYTLRVGPAH